MRWNCLATVACGLAVAWAMPASAQQIDDTYDLKPGDLVQFGGDTYPHNSIYKVVSCEPVNKPYRQCEMIRQSPDPEGHARPFTMNNYTGRMTLIGRGAPAAPARPVAGPVQTRPRVALPGRPAALPATTATGACPRSPYGGPVPGNRPASAALFRQKVTDSITMGAYGPYWYGVRLDNFTVGAPIRNRVSAGSGGATRVTNGAPPNATLYPVSTTMSVCEGAPSGSLTWRTSGKKYFCFITKENEWRCAATN